MHWLNKLVLTKHDFFEVAKRLFWWQSVYPFTCCVLALASGSLVRSIYCFLTVHRT